MDIPVQRPIQRCVFDLYSTVPARVQRSATVFPTRGPKRKQWIEILSVARARLSARLPEARGRSAATQAAKQTASWVLRYDPGYAAQRCLSKMKGQYQSDNRRNDVAKADDLATIRMYYEQQLRQGEIVKRPRGQRRGLDVKTSGYPLPNTISIPVAIHHIQSRR
jgi:hypothetical protein